MTKEIEPTTPNPYGDDYPPSRPGRLTYLIAVSVIVGVVLIMNWPAISSFLHLPQIRASFGLRRCAQFNLARCSAHQLFTLLRQ